MWREAIKARRAAKLEQKRAKAKAWSAANLKAAKSVQKTLKYRVGKNLTSNLKGMATVYLENDKKIATRAFGPDSEMMSDDDDML